MSSIFTKIMNGDLPAYKIFEDDTTYVLLALDQVNLGHCLVVSKPEVNHWFDVPSDVFAAMNKNAQRVASAIKKATDCPRIGTIIAGFEVPHVHIHLIPAWSIPDLDFKRAKRRSDAEMKEIQEKIISFLN